MTTTGTQILLNRLRQRGGKEDLTAPEIDQLADDIAEGRSLGLLRVSESNWNGWGTVKLTRSGWGGDPRQPPSGAFEQLFLTVRKALSR
jgi:hypothetical protein